jgi:hypothetical protein
MGQGAGFLDRFPVVALRRCGILVVRVVAQVLDVGARVGALGDAAGAAPCQWLRPSRSFIKRLALR